MTANTPENPILPDWDVVYDAEASELGLVQRLWGVLPALWGSRQLAWRLFQRNLIANYRQSFLGWFWIFLPPLAAASVWVFLNASGTVRISPLGPVGYAAFVFCGMLLWQGFIDGLMGPTNTLLANRSALTKLQFPREVFVTLCLLETGFDFLVRVVVATLFLIVGGLLDWVGLLLLAIVWGPLLLILGIGLGLWLAPLGLLYKDISRSIAMISPLWMLLTPIIYPLPTGTTGTIVAWVNPPAAIIHVAREGAIRTLESAKAEPSPEAVPKNNLTEPTVADQAVSNRPLDTEPSSPEGNGASQVTPAIPVSLPWLAVVCWCSLGIISFVLGTVWLNVSGPIIIERLAN